MKRIFLFSFVAIALFALPAYGQKKRLSVPNTATIKVVTHVQLNIINLSDNNAKIKLGKHYECTCPAKMTEEEVKDISSKQGGDFIDKTTDCAVTLLDENGKELRTFYLKGILLKNTKAYKLTIYNDDLNLIENVIHR